MLAAVTISHRMRTFHRSFVRVALVLAIAMIANGGVSADLIPRIFEEDSEGVLWETLPAFGRSSAAGSSAIASRRA